MRALQQRLARISAVDELFAQASFEARTICGFQRAVVLGVEQGTLVANATGAVSDPESDALRRAVLGHPVPILADSHESELVRRPDRARASREAISTLKEALGLEHHLLAAVAPEGRTVALLVLDRPAPPVDDAAREKAEIVAHHLELALERLILRQRLRQLADNLRSLTASAQALVQEAVYAPVELPCSNGRGMSLSLFPMGEGRGGAAPSPTDELTARERQIAALLVAGRSNREIAGELHLSPETVKGYVARLLRKLGAANRVEAVAQLARSFQMAES
jgi:DNA-binding CsgD family transcriptional regulator